MQSKKVVTEKKCLAVIKRLKLGVGIEKIVETVSGKRAICGSGESDDSNRPGNHTHWGPLGKILIKILR